MKRVDGLGIPVVANCLAKERAYSDGTGKYLRKKAATTPIGLPIPGSAYTRKIAMKLLRRALPLPAQLLLELIEITRNPNAPPIIPTPFGWQEGCSNSSPSGSGGVTNVLAAAGRLGAAGCTGAICLNNQALGAPPLWTGTITTSSCRLLYLAPGSIGGRFDVMKVIARSAGTPAECFTPCTPTTITQVPGMVPMRMRGPFNPDVELNPRPDMYPGDKTGPKWNPRTTPKFTPKVDPDHWSPPVYPPPPGESPPPKSDPRIDDPEWRYVPPEWSDPNLAPELVPPTAPRVEPPHRPFWAIPGTNTRPVFESPPGHGTERGPTPQPPAPRPELAPPASVVIALPGGTTVQIPPPITRPVTLGGPGVSVTINPPGQPALVSRPPGPRVKERKLIVAVPAGAAKRLIGGITEGLDLVDCLHDALPKHLQARRLRRPPSAGKHANQRAKPSWKRKADAVYRAWVKQIDSAEGHIEHGVQNYVLSANDIMNAIVTCGQQQFMDRIYAEIGRAGGRAGRKLGMSTGTGMGGSARSAVTFGV